MRVRTVVSLAIVAVALFAGCDQQPAGNDPPAAELRSAATVATTVVATGLDNPRGITFGPDGNLYVAEAGVGGTNSTVGQCPQAPFPLGPITGGPTGRVSMIDQLGARTTVAQGLPSAQDNPLVGAVVQLKNSKTLQVRSFITQENGVYQFHGLDPNVDYLLKADYEGASSPWKTLSSFDSRKQATMNLKIASKK